MHNTCIKHGRNIRTRQLGSTSILLWRKDWRTSGKASTTRSIDNDVYWCRIPENSWSRTVLHDKTRWRVLTIYRFSGLSWVHTAKRWKSSDPKGWIRGNTRIGPVLEVTASYCKVNMEWKWELNLWTDNSHSWVRISHGWNKLVTDLIDKEYGDNEQETSETKTEVFAFASRSKAKAKPRRPTSAWRFQYCVDPSGQEILYLRALQGHSGRNPIDPSPQDNVFIPNNFIEYFYHIGCAVNLHSITNSGLIAGRQHSSRDRQTVFFTAVNPTQKDRGKPDMKVNFLWALELSSIIERDDPSWTLSHQATQNGMLIKFGLLKSGNLMN